MKTKYIIPISVLAILIIISLIYFNSQKEQAIEPSIDTIVVDTTITTTNNNIQPIEDNQCKEYQIIIEDILLKSKKSQNDSLIIQIPAKDKNYALKEVMNLLISLNCEQDKSQEDLYNFPNEAGYSKIKSYENDECIFISLLINNSCINTQVKEIQYVRLKCYNKE